MKNNKPKVIVIGLDGATFKILNPWMEQGLLPNLKFLMDNGASGELESTMPRHSAPAWTSFMTGVNPGKHGLFGFFKPFHDERFKKELTTSRDIKSKTIFEILSEYGKISGVINLPMTYPPFKINGFMVGCGLTTPSTDFDFTYPKDLFKRVGFKRTDYILNVHPKNYSNSEKTKFFSDLIKEAEQKKEISFKLMSSYDWDLFVLIFGGTDRLQHFYWHYIDPEHPQYNPTEAQKFLPLIIKYYQKLDSLIGDFINHIDDNTSLLIMSDHGFDPFEKKIAINKVLNQNGLLYYRAESFIEKFNTVQHKIRGFLQHNSFIYREIKIIIKFVGHALKGKTFKTATSEQKLKKQLGAATDKYWQKIDWKRTFGHNGFADNSICLNLKGREPKGIINTNGEYLKVQNQIIDIISDLFEPSRRRKLKVAAYKKEEIYTGPYVQDAPDLFFEIEDGGYMFHGIEDDKGIFEAPVAWTGRHAKNGILICYGNNIKKGIYIKNSRIIDLASTIFYLLGVKIPKYMDGEILEDALYDEFLKNNPIDFNNAPQERKLGSDKEEVYSNQDMEKVKKHLSDLGYL